MKPVPWKRCATQGTSFWSSVSEISTIFRPLWGVIRKIGTMKVVPALKFSGGLTLFGLSLQLQRPQDNFCFTLSIFSIQTSPSQQVHFPSHLGPLSAAQWVTFNFNFFTFSLTFKSFISLSLSLPTPDLLLRHSRTWATCVSGNFGRKIGYFCIRNPNTEFLNFVAIL
jgi:hypothetical protein